MAQERPTFENGRVYHVYNRGVAKNPLFTSDADHRHLLDTLSFFREAQPTTKLSNLKPAALLRTLAAPVQQALVEILAYCLMPNHFHLVLRQVVDGGITTYLSRAQNSYSRYFNVKHDRVGTMFQGRFQAVVVRTDEQLLHLSRYVHLNAPVARIVELPAAYPWSSYQYYMSETVSRLCQPSTILELAGSSAQYQTFVEDFVGYARSLHDLKDLLLELEYR